MWPASWLAAFGGYFWPVALLSNVMALASGWLTNVVAAKPNG
jgi:hypothetical protein